MQDVRPCQINIRLQRASCLDRSVSLKAEGPVLYLPRFGRSKYASSLSRCIHNDRRLFLLKYHMSTRASLKSNSPGDWLSEVLGFSVEHPLSTIG